MQRLFADFVWLSDGWHADVALDIDDSGHFQSVTPNASPENRERIGRFVLPGIPNLHSHAFQRAMAGLAERQRNPEDSFWTWRELMYGFAARIDPESLLAIASQLYLEMLESGYTSVCEFHYLHHRPDGQPYAPPQALAEVLIAAAAEVGIGLTLLPTLYMTGGFDGRALTPRQMRFRHGVDDYLRLFEALRAQRHDRLEVGLCFHSLRAVPESAMREVLAANTGPLPIHIHIAEQIGEVQDCVAIRGLRPVEWLLDRFPVDFRWSLVHATHLNSGEVRGIARSGATVVICPTTEANLGDGLFPLREFIDAGGHWGIGSDSHISVSPVEELRWLEYGQRLQTRRRNVAVQPQLPSTGDCLFAHALAGGARSAMQSAGWIEGREESPQALGTRADLLVLDEASPQLAARGADVALDSWLFSGNQNLVRDVMVGGRWVVRAGRHSKREQIAARYIGALQRLRDSM